MIEVDNARLTEADKRNQRGAIKALLELWLRDTVPAGWRVAQGVLIDRATKTVGLVGVILIHDAHREDTFDIAVTDMAEWFREFDAEQLQTLSDGFDGVGSGGPYAEIGARLWEYAQTHHVTKGVPQ